MFCSSPYHVTCKENSHLCHSSTGLPQLGLALGVGGRHSRDAGVRGPLAAWLGTPSPCHNQATSCIYAIMPSCHHAMTCPYHHRQGRLSGRTARRRRQLTQRPPRRPLRPMRLKLAGPKNYGLCSANVPAPSPEVGRQGGPPLPPVWCGGPVGPTPCAPSHAPPPPLVRRSLYFMGPAPEEAYPGVTPKAMPAHKGPASTEGSPAPWRGSSGPLAEAWATPSAPSAGAVPEPAADTGSSAGAGDPDHESPW